MTTAFGNRARRTVLLLFTFTVALFAISSYRLIDRQRTQRSLDQAHLCGQVISRSATSTPDDQLLHHLQATSTSCVGVARIDALGRPKLVLAATPDQRERILSGLQAAAGAPPPRHYAFGSLLGVPIVEQIAAGSGGGIVFSQQPSVVFPWLGATTVFVLFLLAMTFVALRSLRRWFEQHVGKPLKALTVLAPNSTTVSDRAAPPQMEWKETAQIAWLLGEFIGRLNENDARAYRLEQDAAHRLRQCEEGYDRELRRAQERATTDPLTRLRNRAFLEAEGPALFNCHKELRRPLAAIMLDLDNFKKYNDAHGHQVGDALLRFVGGLLRGSIRPADHAVRYGGDEFLLLMPGATGQEAQAIGDRLIKLFAQYTACLEESEGLSLSAGVASLPDSSCADVWRLIARADRALYEAKFNGKSAVVLAPAAECESQESSNPIARLYGRKSLAG